MKKIYKGKCSQPDLPSFVPYLMVLDLLFCPTMLIIGLIKRKIIFFILMLIGYMIGKVFEIFFNWHIGYYYEIDDNDKLSYHYFLNGLGVGNNKTVINIKKVDSFKFKVFKKRLEIKGKFIKKVPHRQDMELDKIVVQIDLEESNRDEIITKLKDYM